MTYDTIEDCLYEVGPGWHALVRVAWAGKPATVVLTQVKEKFGQLRIYHGPPHEEYQELLDVLEYVSSQVCERCGAKAKVSEVDGWLKAMCSTCLQGYRDRYPGAIIHPFVLESDHG